MTDYFHGYAAAGFLQHIIPILPHDAKLRPQSRLLAPRRGKIPGRYIAAEDAWCGFGKWTKHITTPADIDEWATWPGAGLGLRTGGLVAIDVDITDEKLSKAIFQSSKSHLGPACCRVGRFPKFLLLYRLADGEQMFGKFRQTVRGADGVKHAVEVLGHGRQFVAEGIHPATKEAYSWYYGHPCEMGFKGLPTVKAKDVFPQSAGQSSDTTAENSAAADESPAK